MLSLKIFLYLRYTIRKFPSSHNECTKIRMYLYLKIINYVEKIVRNVRTTFTGNQYVQYYATNRSRFVINVLRICFR